MRTGSLALALLADLVTLGASTSISGLPSACNGTAASSTGVTGTGLSTRISSSLRISYIPSSSASRSSVSNNGTKLRSTGIAGSTAVTGTGSHGSNSTISSHCLATTTFTSYTTEFVTTGPVESTSTEIGGGPVIDGDLLTPVDGTAIATISATATTTLAETTTQTIFTIPAVTIGVSSTITVPPPTGFLPVQSTLPNATYSYQNPCDVSTTTITSTDFIIVGTVTVTTLTGTLIYFPAENTIYPSAEFSNFSISYVTSTTTLTEYASTVRTTTPADATNTFTATTTTVYEACATNNFADSIVVDHSAIYINFFQQNTTTQAFSGLVFGPANIYDCCNYAFSQNADVWTYASDLGCAIITGTDGVCTPSQTNDTVTLPRFQSTSDIHLTVGNAQCGQWRGSVIDQF